MNYTLHQLQVFWKVTQTKSITKAAEELHLTQPAVSIQLKNFQDQFEIPLTEVVGRKLYVTDFGMEVARAAEKILDEVDAINFKTLAFKGQLTGRLKISVVSTGKYIMPYLLSEFLRMHPGVELQLDVTNKSLVVESLERNEVDFALMSVVPKHLHLHSIPLMENQLYVMGNSEVHIDAERYPSEYLRELPLIFREKGSGSRLVLEQYMQARQWPIRPKMELTSNEAVKQAVMAGLGVSVLPLIGVRMELQLGLLKIIPIEGFPLSSRWELVWQSTKKLSPVAEAYTNWIRLHASSTVAHLFEETGIVT